ncbi:MAG TPA: hypothetical protein VJK72_01125 [Candidatus Nanoarchaeia archaeon]|nr:hypothetical protein [Candidatus Nanoarchaeia archaeon]
MFKRGSIDISISTIVLIMIATIIFMAGVYFLLDFLLFAGDTEEGVAITVGQRGEIRTAAEAREEKEQAETTKQLAKSEPIVQLEPPVVKDNCAKDLSCDYYFVFVPLGNWKADAEFETKVEERMLFMTDISKFKDKKVGTLRVPLNKMSNCRITKIDPFSASHHQKIKSCADKYADSLGIDYERAIGLSNGFEGGRAFFGSKVMFVSLGFNVGGTKAERIGIVAHELGHTYDLCDEYSFTIWKEQRGYVTGKECENKWPEYCDKTIDDCEGNTPTQQDYEGDPLDTVCYGSVHYSIMGYSKGSECGLDRTGGYEAYGDIS